MCDILKLHWGWGSNTDWCNLQ